LEGQRGEAVRNAEHLSKEEQAAEALSAEKAKEAAPAAVESFASKDMAGMVDTLAKIDGVSDDPRKIKHFHALLVSLGDKYGDSGQQIGDRTAEARTTMRDKGVSETCLDILKGMNQAYAGTVIAPLSYADAVRSYVSLRAEGKSHADVVDNLAAMMSRMPGNTR
jgi:hypothetical protein